MLSNEDQRWCQDTIAHTISHIKENVERDADYDWSMDIAVECYFKALAEVATPDPHTSEDTLMEIVEKAIDRSLEYWDYVCASLDAQYEEFHCQRWGLISAMLAICMGSMQHPHNKVLYKYITGKGAEKYEGRFFEDLNQDGYEALTDEEIAELTKGMDPNLLKEFFERFADLKVFYGNSTKYQDDEEAKLKQRKLLAVYERLFRSK